MEEYNEDIAGNRQSLVSYNQFVDRFNRPPSKVCLLYGDSSAFQFSLWMTSSAASMGKTIAIVDGCNRSNVHLISRYARQHGIDPSMLLRRVFISRGFTCYQMEAAITERLPGFLKQAHSSTALIFGLLDTFYDEQAPLHEVRKIFTRILTSFREMKMNGISLLLVSEAWNVVPRERNQLFASLKTAMDQVFRLERAKETPRLFLENVSERNFHGKNGSNIH